jgi:hypothetical protein
MIWGGRGVHLVERLDVLVPLDRKVHEDEASRRHEE